MAFDTHVLRVEGPKDLSSWYRSLVRAVQWLQRCHEAEIEDNGFAIDPGLFVTSGVRGRLRSAEFTIWSDLPCELIIEHKRNSRDAEALEAHLLAFYCEEGT